jgi:hypothetical protein
MRTSETMLEQVEVLPPQDCRTCPYLAGECSRCPRRAGLGQSGGQAALSVEVDTGNLTDQINWWLASPSPLFGVPWELVLIVGFGLWAVRSRARGGR